MQDVCSSQVQNMQVQDQTSPFVGPDNGEVKTTSLASDEDELNCAEEVADGDENGEVGQIKKESFWPRMKWTDVMVKLLVTALSYIGEDHADGVGGRKKAFIVQKKGKWRSISNVMAERGFHVSPRQCEDKFNDLNKRYKKLNDVLGRGTTCMVVENPSLLDTMNLSEKEKEEVKKILSSKHLFYEEMCSYHNGNRLFLPHDPDLQKSLNSALKSKDDLPNKNKEFVEEEQDAEAKEKDAEASEQDDGTGENGNLPEAPAKRSKRMDLYEDACLGKCNFSDRNRRIDARNDFTDVQLEGNSADELRKQWLTYRSLQLEEQSLHIKAQMLELEKQRFKWQKFSWKQDKELEHIKLENECMRLENERMALEIESKKLGSK